MNRGTAKTLLLVKVVAIIAILETAVHLFVRALPLGKEASLLDSALLAAIAAPVFWLWVIREEASLQAARQRQARLNELLCLSLEAAPLAEKLARMLECLVSTPWLAVERKGCVMVREGGVLRMAAQTGISYPASSRKECARLPLGRCLCGHVAQTGEEILTAQADARHDVACEGMEPHGHMTMPLKAGSELQGALSLYLKEGQTPDAGQREFARAAADVFSGVVLMARSEEMFLQAQKMEAVGRLAGGVAHDFNNILTAIKGYAAFVQRTLTPGDRRREDVEEIGKAADRGAELTRQLLAFSRRQVISPRSLNLNDVVKGMTKMLRRLLGEDIQVRLRLEPSLAATVADKGQLEQVIMNLAVNARDAMPDGGTLTVTTQNSPRSSSGGDPACGRVLLSIADTGTGIEGAVLDRIFEPFFSTKPKDRGTGLGLATVYGIVKQTGGDIEVTSAPGQGSSFKVFLPAGAAAPAAAIPSKPEPSLPSGRESVLIVEDEAPVRALMERQLSEAGYRVLAAGGGAEALSLLERRPEPVDLLITDVVLPGMNGPQLVEKLLTARPAVKILYVSGYSDAALLSDQGTLREGVELLPKPFSSGGLVLRVRELLDARAA